MVLGAQTPKKQTSLIIKPSLQEMITLYRSHPTINIFAHNLPQLGIIKSNEVEF